MIYQHQYFQLDTESRKVFDENGKELVLTGNAYRMLVFLCEKKHATLTEIGDYLDHAKEYTENHLRQYRYKIETIIGRNIIEYKNSIYSVIGDIQESLEMAKVERNTDLLRSNPIQSETGKPKELAEMKFMKFPALIAIVMLLFSFFDWSYGYYTFLRIIMTGSGVYYAYYFYAKEKKQGFWFWAMIMLAIIFNPVLVIHFNKSVWGVIDLFAIIFMTTFIIKFRKLTATNL